MKLSDIRTRIESGTDDQAFLAAKTDEPEKTPVLTLVDTAERSEGCDPLIQALVDKLPKPNTIWPMGDRAKWLRATAVAFNLVYKPDEGDEHDLKIEKSHLNSAG
jgi:3-methyladenine DNA glycosylase AlkD